MFTRNFLAVLFIFILISCEEILLENDITQKSIEILSPKNNTVVEAATINFNWTEIEGATAYEIQIAAPDFENAQQIIITTIVEESSYSEDLLSGDYEWRVRGINSGYNTGFASAKFKAETTENFSSRQVSLLSPSQNYITNLVNITLEWQEVEGASEYRIQITENGEIIKEETTSGTTKNIEFPEGEFIWKVRAESQTQNTLYSDRTILVDKNAPITPILSSPENNSTISIPTVTFEWTRGITTGSVETDTLFIYKDIGLEELVGKQKVNNSYTTILEREETYYWFMRAYDEAGNSSAGSEVFSFSIN